MYSYFCNVDLTGFRKNLFEFFLAKKFEIFCDSCSWFLSKDESEDAEYNDTDMNEDDEDDTSGIRLRARNRDKIQSKNE